MYSECRLCICILHHLLPLLTSFKLALTDLASFPGSCVGREKRGTHCLRMFSWIFEISMKSVCYTNLHETCRLFLPERCLPLTTVCVDDDKGAIKVNKLFAYRNYPCSICSSQMLWHMTDAIFPFEVYRLSWTKWCRQLTSEQYCFWLLRCLTGSIILQCGLSPHKQKFPLL